MYQRELELVGLSVPEAKIYEALLKNGSSSASELAKLTGLGRTNIYDYTNSLEKQGLVNVKENKGKTLFEAHSPALLKELANNKLRVAKEAAIAFADVFPSLNELYSGNSVKPEVTIFEGQSAFEAVCEHIYSAHSRGDICWFVADLDEYLLPEPKFRSIAQRHGRKTILIANKGEILQEYNLRDERELRSTLVIDKAVFHVLTEYIATDDTVIYVDKSSPNVRYVMIKSATMATFACTTARMLLHSITLV